MKYKIKLGVVCLTRATFDVQAAHHIFDHNKEKLIQIEDVEWYFKEDPILEVEEAEVTAREFASEGVDGVVIISGTFHLGHLALVFSKIVCHPILLWAFKELPYDGGKIRLNSVCGLNLNASNLYKSGDDTYHVISGDDIDEDWIDAVRIKSAIQNARIAVVGSRAHGFFNLGVDELRLFSEIGVLADIYPIYEMYNQEVSQEEIEGKEVEVKEIFNTTGLSTEQVTKVARLIVSTKKFMDKNRLTGLAVRCWPEYAQQYGISPCAAMSILQSQGYILGCEGDIEGTLTMLACKAVGAETPFLADLSQVNFEEDFALMWHCGVAPCNLWDGKCSRSLDKYFAGGKGVTADFVLKSGKVNIFRLDSARGKTRVYMAAGNAMEMSKDLKGTYAKVRFEKNIRELLEQVAYTGVAHHVALVYGEFRRPFEIFARLMKWETIK